MPTVKMHMLITLDNNDVSKRSLDMGSKCFFKPKPWKYNERFKEFLQKNHDLLSGGIKNSSELEFTRTHIYKGPKLYSQFL
jgi:hypothetical protein